MMVSTIVLAIVNSVNKVIPIPDPKPDPKPDPSHGIKDWIKKQLVNISNLLTKLGAKAAAALPGIIGSIL